MQPIALCDCYSKNLERGAQMLSQKFPEFSRHKDFRELLENKDIDAVVIATSDHWHCLCTLYAADAGKNIYCEKPLSTTIAEGNAMVDAVRRNKVIFQGGNMQRSGKHFQEAVQMIWDGYIGDVARVETWSYDNGPIAGIGMGDSDISKYEVDWDWHQGWVEHRPFNTNRWIYNFRWFLEYSGGKITDWGAHLIDIALWGMGEDKQPKRISANGGKYLIQDNRTTPDTLEVCWEFDNYQLTFSNRVWNPQLLDGTMSDHGIVFYGTKGLLRVDRGAKGHPLPEQRRLRSEGGTRRPIERTSLAELRRLCSFRTGSDFQSGSAPQHQPRLPHGYLRVCRRCTLGFRRRNERWTTSRRAPASGVATIEWDDASQKFKGGDTEAVAKANMWAYREYKNGWSLKAPYRTV